jgi:branched-chain amino acid transport system substrate-binding protein
LSAGVGGAGVASASGSLAPIKVGVVCSCTGPLSSSIIVGPPAYQAWADYTNAHGGIDGHKVQVIEVNDDYNPATSLSEVQKLVSTDHVVAIVDSSDVDAAWSKYVTSAGIPVVGGGSSGELEDTDADWFAVGQTLDDYFINFIDAAKKVGASNIGEFYCAEAATCQEGVAPFEATAKKVNEKVGYVTQVSYSAPNYDAQCIAAKQAGVEALTVADAVAVVESVASDCVKQGYTPWQIALDGAVGQSFLTAPGLENHFIGSEPNIPFFADSTPASKLMNATLKKYADATTLKSPNYNEQATQMYVSGLMLTAAVQERCRVQQDDHIGRHQEGSLRLPQRDARWHGAAPQLQEGPAEPSGLLVLDPHPEREVHHALRSEARVRGTPEDQLRGREGSSC